MNGNGPDLFARWSAILASGNATHIRRKGLLRTLIGLLGCLLVGVVIWLLSEENILMPPILLLICALPGAYTLLGLVEAMSGVPYRDLARRWDNLTGAQRLVLGVLIVIVAWILMAYLFPITVVPLLSP